jgi:hypothetical protein
MMLASTRDNHVNLFNEIVSTRIALSFFSEYTTFLHVLVETKFFLHTQQASQAAGTERLHLAIYWSHSD